MCQHIKQTISSGDAVSRPETDPPLNHRIKGSNVKKTEINGRRKLWKISAKLLCPVIGTCISATQLKKLAIKAGDQDIQQASDYAIHTRFVSSAQSKNMLSYITHKYLDRHYQTEIRVFKNARSDSELNQLWQEHLHNGSIAGGFWALVTHPLCDVEISTRAYEHIHMLSHQIGCRHRQEIETLSKARTTLQQLTSTQQKTNQKLEQRIKNKQSTIDNLRLQLRQLRVLQSELSSRNRKLEEFETNKHLQPLKDLNRQNIQLQNENKFLQQQLQCQREYATLTGEQKPPLNACTAEEQEATLDLSCLDSEACASENCPAVTDLNGRKVLCVGGRRNLINHYRQVVMQCNGEFIYHDGGKEESYQRLNSLLDSADAVICPIDNISHDAVNRCKRRCKKQQKLCLMLNGSGVSTFTNSLQRISQPCSNRC